VQLVVLWLEKTARNISFPYNSTGVKIGWVCCFRITISRSLNKKAAQEKRVTDVKVIHTDEIVAAVERLCVEANFFLGEDMLRALENAKISEENPMGRMIIEQLLENAEIAGNTRVPICQDTGMAIVFVELGQNVQIEGLPLTEAINQGVRQGYVNGFLRKSIVADPTFNRVNTRDNTPAVIHYDIVPGDELKITVAPKGFGSENMGGVKLCTPSDGVEGVIKFVVDTVDGAGGNCCPPIVVGVGVGGDMEKAAIMAKKALLRNIGDRNPDQNWSQIEETILERLNKLGIGPQGLGGTQTALDVFIETFPTHIAGMPVAVNINCHAARHKEVILKGEKKLAPGAIVLNTPLTPTLIAKGLTGMLGKGLRSKEVIKSMKDNGAVYFVAIGGAGAFLSRCIKSSEVVAYSELGPEAVRKLTVENLPAIVAIDTNGNNIFEMIKARFRKK